MPRSSYYTLIVITRNESFDLIFDIGQGYKTFMGLSDAKGRSLRKIRR